MGLKNVSILLIIGLLITGVVVLILLTESRGIRATMSGIPFNVKKSVLNCVPEGGYALQCGGDKDEQCCDGLQSLDNNFLLDSSGKCSEVYGICGSVVCTDKCGNGICDGKENKCNCPADCN